MNINWIAIALAIMLIGVIIWVAIGQIKEHHMQDDPMLHYLRQILEPLHPAVKKLKLYQAKKSYTLNKTKIYLKLKDENGDYYPLNHLLHVCTHEMAHYLNKKDVGHTEEFHRIFDELLERAQQLRIFNPSIPLVSDY